MMPAESKIREALKALMAEGEANACQIFLGYSMTTDQIGWHFVRFGQTATHIGRNLAEALEWIESEADQGGKI